MKGQAGVTMAQPQNSSAGCPAAQRYSPQMMFPKTESMGYIAPIAAPAKAEAMNSGFANRRPKMQLNSPRAISPAATALSASDVKRNDGNLPSSHCG
jgi:hypothetical protein